TGFAFDPTTGWTFMLNETGLVILKEFRKGCGENAAAERLVREREISLPAAQRDVADFSSNLSALGLS
ncbi:MAG: PqqD family protein, partial [Desulfobacterales bacterium]|nr:PqqD family protein [Desulfobacterales bacterium]